jgi:hypothetical protein
MDNINKLHEAGELRVAYQIKRQLNASLANIDGEKLERLRAAREQALTRKRKGSTAVATAGGPLMFFGFDFAWTAHLVPLAVLVFGLITMNYWHQSRYTEEVADIDAQMLVDDLPPNAYLDQGFNSWLRASSENADKDAPAQ